MRHPCYKNEPPADNDHETAEQQTVSPSRAISWSPSSSASAAPRMTNGELERFARLFAAGCSASTAVAVAAGDASSRGRLRLTPAADDAEEAEDEVEEDDEADDADELEALFGDRFLAHGISGLSGSAGARRPTSSDLEAAS